MPDYDVTVKSFRAAGRTLTAKEAFTITPVREGRLYVYKKDDIALDCYVEPKDLHKAPRYVTMELAFLWREYALEADEKLDPEALQVKKNLLAQFAPEA